MPSILLTGGAGFIGSHTAQALLDQGHAVRVLDILDPQIHGEGAGFPAHLDHRVEALRGDVRDPATVSSAIKDVDAVFHFAARTGVGQSMYDIAAYVDHNVGGTAVLLEAIARRKTPLTRFVLASSRAVYGEGAAECDRHGVVSPEFRRRDALDSGDFDIHCPACGRTARPIPTPEDAPLDPGSVYALTKRMQEELCTQAAGTFDLPLTILRYFNVYGSRQSLHNPYTGVATVFFNRLSDGLPLALYEHGLPTRDFVHISDVVDANLAALELPAPPGSCVNVGGGEPITIRDLALALARLLGVQPDFEDSGEYRVGDILACTADLGRAREHLGYTPRMSLEDGLREFLAWAAEQDRTRRIPFDRTVSELRRHGLLRSAGADRPPSPESDS
jgi:dTDP-L-rhamnose 4-epimerase